MKKKTNDQLFQSYTNFQVNHFNMKTMKGGASRGSSSDPDGCTAVWFDLHGGGYHHTDDFTTCD
jgi:hypothetical protein